MKESRSDKFDPVELAHAALDAGMRYFDSAPSYGNGQSERNYGEVLEHRRKEVFLAAKTGQRTYDGAMREFEESLKRLRTDHVDLLQIHGARVDEDLAAWGKPDGVFKALEKLRDQKLTRLHRCDRARKCRRDVPGHHDVRLRHDPHHLQPHGQAKSLCRKGPCRWPTARDWASWP